MCRQRKNYKSAGGVAVLEFLFAAPAFVVMVLFVVEIALIWGDRHVMRLAAYRAAKSVIKTRGDLAPSATQLCWPALGQVETNEGKIVRNAARRAAAKTMSAVTPSVAQMLPLFGNSTSGQGLEQGILMDVDSKFGNGSVTANSTSEERSSAMNSNPYIHAVYRMLVGLPAAWLFTELNCKDFEGGKHVEIALTYNRSAKMPFIGNMMWLMHLLMSRGANPISGNVEYGDTGFLRINPLDYGVDISVNLNDPAVRELVKQKAMELVSKIAENATSLGVEIPSGGAGTAVFETAAKNAVTELVNAAFESNAVSRAQQIVNESTAALESVLLLYPNMLKTIPVKVSVKLANFNSAVENEDQAWKGSTYLLGKFGDNSIVGKLSQNIGNTVDKYRNERKIPAEGLVHDVQ